MRQDFVRMTKGDALSVILKTGIGFYVLIAVNIYWINKINTEQGTGLSSSLYWISAIIITVVWSIIYWLLTLRIAAKQKQLEQRKLEAARVRKEYESKL